MTTSSFESGIFDPLTGGDGQASKRRREDASSATGAGAQAARDRILNAYFDQDGTVSRERLRSGMRADSQLAVDFERTEAVLSEMNLRDRPVGGPDVSQAVLSRVNELQPYVAGPVRRQVSSARIAAVGAVLSGITLVVVLNRVSVSSFPASAGVDDEPVAAGVTPSLPARSAAPASDTARTSRESSLRRLAGLEVASKYDQINTGLGDVRMLSQALDQPPGSERLGGGDSSDAGYRPIVQRRDRPFGIGDRLEWASFLGYPMLVPVRSAESEATAGATGSPR